MFFLLDFTVWVVSVSLGMICIYTDSKMGYVPRYGFIGDANDVTINDDITVNDDVTVKWPNQIEFLRFRRFTKQSALDVNWIVFYVASDPWLSHCS
ncbi:hypothetical protein GDO86_018546 [Hymenochirus boettgeri]|uniref:Uncharacterized protein n=1 Tax=Hymenochirus boettgeri TaxID=247094 RepID=A0A8T2IAD9_9PIPI|nr:hypothetical protein GDO86_018546 [Hymenochirus boettgeri]